MTNLLSIAAFLDNPDNNGVITLIALAIVIVGGALIFGIAIHFDNKHNR